VSRLRDDALGEHPVAEDVAPDAGTGRDGVALLCALRVPVVRAVGHLAGALREPGLRLAVLASASQAGGGGGMNYRTDPHFTLGVEHAKQHWARETGWTDPELQRRYNLGYDFARDILYDGLSFEQFDRLMTERGYNR